MTKAKWTSNNTGYHLSFVGNEIQILTGCLDGDGDGADADGALAVIMAVCVCGHARACESLKRTRGRRRCMMSAAHSWLINVTNSYYT